jgi:hypothetical protein
MIFLSQYILSKYGDSLTEQSIQIYSIAIGIVLYAAIYIYLMFYNTTLLQVFNKFLIYIVSVDLLMSTFINLGNKKVELLETSFDLPKNMDENENESYDSDNSEDSEDSVQSTNSNESNTPSDDDSDGVTSTVEEAENVINNSDGVGAGVGGGIKNDLPSIVELEDEDQLN